MHTFSHRSDDKDAVAVLDFVGEAHCNHLVDTLAALCTMLMEPDGLAARKHLRLLHLALGPAREWPDRVATALQVALLIGIAVLWHKLIVYFESYPWALAPAFDTTRSPADRRAALEAFFRVEPCCFDTGLCRQLRKAFPSDVSVYVDTALSEFLTTVFTRLVMTSTQVELQFSKLSAITNHPHSRIG